MINFLASIIRVRFLPVLCRPAAVCMTAGALMAAGGCNQKDLYYPGDPMTVTVRFDWSEAPEAVPAGMSLYFYPLSTEGEIWRFDIAGDRGGPVSIPCGEYRLVAYNNDLPGVFIEDTDSFYGLKAIARYPERDNMIRSPGMLYSGTVDYISVSPSATTWIPGPGETAVSSNEIVCIPLRRTARYTVKVLDVEGIERAGPVKCTLEGIASSVTLSEGRPGGIPSGVEEPMSADAETRSLEALIEAFPGLPSVAPYTLTITAPDGDDSVFSRSYDVTSQVMNQPDSLNVMIVINGLVLPSGNNTSDNVGMDVGVGEWKDIVTDYTISLP